MKPDFTQPIVVEKDDIHQVALYFNWGQNTIGFGQCSIHFDPETGAIKADTENMDREWLRRALHSLVDTLVDNAVIE